MKTLIFFSKFLIAIGIVLLIATPVIWGVKGASKGWSATQVLVMKTDPVTEMEFPDWEKKLVLGVDFLAAGILAGLGAFGAGLLAGRIAVRKPKPHAG